MKKLYLLYLLALFTTVISKEVTGVFNQFNSLIWSYTYRARYEEISTLTAKAQLNGLWMVLLPVPVIHLH